MSCREARSRAANRKKRINASTITCAHDRSRYCRRLQNISDSDRAAPSWITFEWLSQIVYAAIYALAGWAGVVAWASAPIALALGPLTRFVLRELTATPAVLTVLAVIVLKTRRLVARAASVATVHSFGDRRALSDALQG